MNVWRSGTSVCSRASARTSSRSGDTSSPAASATTPIELLVGVRERESPRPQEHGQVVDHIGGLFAHALVGLARGGVGHLGGLLAHLLADPRGIAEQLGGVAALGAIRVARGDRALEL